MSGWSFPRAARFLLAAALAGAAAGALAQTAQEHEVKAAFLYRFLTFIEWPKPPAQPPAPLVIGTLGADDIAAALERVLPGRTAQNRPVAVRRLRPGESPAGVHLLMVGRSEQERMAQLAKGSALLVGESENALARGAAINFLVDEGRVRFEVSLAAAEKSGVRISARMLAVAHDVRGSVQ